MTATVDDLPQIAQAIQADLSWIEVDFLGDFPVTDFPVLRAKVDDLHDQLAALLAAGCEIFSKDEEFFLGDPELQPQTPGGSKVR